MKQIIIDARPAKVKKFSWGFPIHKNQDGDDVQQLVKRKLGAGIFLSLISFKIIDLISSRLG